MNRTAAGGAGAAVAAGCAQAAAPESKGFAVFVRSIETKEVPLTEAEIAAKEAEREESLRKLGTTASLTMAMLADVGGGGTPTKTVRAEPTIPFLPVGMVGLWNGGTRRYDPAGDDEEEPDFGCVPLANAFLFQARGMARGFARCLVSVDSVEGGYNTPELHVGGTSKYDGLEWEVREIFASDLASPEASRPVPANPRRPKVEWWGPTAPVGDKISWETKD